ncbi:hypothetical protein C5167_033814 [Papaver somniferum]|uniref:Uncharacterized protein n=1 Tax=Papaver somniferum TaxID=3469 RepID=A0A4Y7KE89_PAPSO|nr:suppressor of disruption of TFIIS-like [Papaver somniferum]RZC70672.1 hypothetical protein C5167_033814 [Papaver somniferum]
MDQKDSFHSAETDPKYDCVLFDVDDTLYPFSSGLAVECRKNIEEYMRQKLGIDETKIEELCTQLYKIYGTTMAGLRAIGYDFDYDDFHSFVHGRLPYNQRLKPDPVLRSILLSLPLRKVIFTNSNEAHAAEVLKVLGLEGCFESIICFETLNPTNSSDKGDCKAGDLETTPITTPFDIMGYGSQPNADTVLPKTPILCKPSEAAFERALEIANINQKRTVFFDDSVRNIQSGKLIGLHTVLVGTSQRIKGADYALESIHNITEALPELWGVDGNSGKVLYSGKVAIEATVTA